MATKKSRKKAGSLATQVEKISDTKDAQPKDHIVHFFKTFGQDLHLPEIDLTTVDGANQAKSVLAERATQLSKKLSTLQALKKLYGP